MGGKRAQVNRVVDGFNTNRWVLFGASILTVVGLIALGAALLGNDTEDDGRTFKVEVEGTEGGGETETDYVSFSIENTWTDANLDDTSEWATGPLLMFGVPFQNTFGTELRPGVSHGIRFRLPSGLRTQKLLLAQVDTTPVEVALTYKITVGTSTFESVTDPEAKSIQAVTIDLPDDAKYLTVEVSYDADSEAPTAFAAAAFGPTTR